MGCGGCGQGPEWRSSMLSMCALEAPWSALDPTSSPFAHAAGFEDKTAYAQCIFAYTPSEYLGMGVQGLVKTI